VVGVGAFRREASIRAGQVTLAWPGLPPRVPIAETGPVSERLCVREIDDDERQRLVRIIRRGSGSAVTWRRVLMMLLSAQGMDVAAIAKVAFTSDDRVRDVMRNLNADGPGRCTRSTGAAIRRSSRWASVTFQRLKTWKTSRDPQYAVKKARIERLYAIADREVTPEPGETEVIFCVDE
jgi:hypothetical protein